MGGKFHPKLNICLRPIANKYHEGKLKRTLKRELKVCEIAEMEVNNARCHLMRLLCVWTGRCMFSASMHALCLLCIYSVSHQASVWALVLRQTFGVG